MDFGTVATQVGEFLASGQGDFVGGIATSVTLGLIGHASGAVRRRFRPSDKREALVDTIKRALVATFLDLRADADRLQHLLEVMGKWAETDEVRDYLVLLIDPRANQTLDLAVLAASFADQGYDAATLEIDLQPRLLTFIDMFVQFARRNHTLIDDQTLQIDLLQQMLSELADANSGLRAIRDNTARTAIATEQLSAYVQQIIASYSPTVEAPPENTARARTTAPTPGARTPSRRSTPTMPLRSYHKRRRSASSRTGGSRSSICMI